MYAVQANGPQYVPIDPFKPSIAFSLNNFPTWLRRAKVRASASPAGNDTTHHFDATPHLEQGHSASRVLSSSPGNRRDSSVRERRERPGSVQRQRPSDYVSPSLQNGESMPPQAPRAQSRAFRRSYSRSVRRYRRSSLERQGYPPVMPGCPPVPSVRREIISGDQLRGRSLYRNGKTLMQSGSTRSRRSRTRSRSRSRSPVQSIPYQRERLGYRPSSLHSSKIHGTKHSGSPIRLSLQSMSLEDIESKSSFPCLPISLRRHPTPQRQPIEESFSHPYSSPVPPILHEIPHSIRPAPHRRSPERTNIRARSRSSSRFYYQLQQNHYQLDIQQEYKNVFPESGQWVPTKLERDPTPLPQPIEELPSTPSLIVAFMLDTVPRQIYLHVLLRLPYLYYSRVTRIFEEAEMSLPVIRERILDAARAKLGHGTTTQSQPGLVHAQNRASGNHTFLGLQPEPPKSNTAYLRLQDTWEGFIDSLLREWKTLNIISVLLLSAILTILQIETAASDPLTRYAALLSMICALMSLLYGCIYIIRFGTMRKTYKGAEWAEEAQRSTTGIFWNVWVLLAMPATWLSWSMVLYIITVMAFVWRTSPIPTDDTTTPSVSISQILAAKTIISCVLALGIIYLGLITTTLRRYGTMMDRAWQRRIWKWMADGVANTNLHINANTMPPLFPGPPKFPEQNYTGLPESPAPVSNVQIMYAPSPVPFFMRSTDQSLAHFHESNALPNAESLYPSFIQFGTPSELATCISPSALESANNDNSDENDIYKIHNDNPPEGSEPPENVVGYADSAQLVKIFGLSLDDPHAIPSSFVRDSQGPNIAGNIPCKDTLLTQFNLLRKGLRVIIASSAARMENPETFDMDCLSELSFAVREFNELLQEDQTAGQVILCHEFIKKRPGIPRLGVYYITASHFLYDIIFHETAERSSESNSSITEAKKETRTIPCSLPSGVERLEVVSPLLQLNFKRSSDAHGDSYTEERRHEMRCEEEHKIAGSPPICITFVNSKPVAINSTGKKENKVFSI